MRVLAYTSRRYQRRCGVTVEDEASVDGSDEVRDSRIDGRDARPDDRIGATGAATRDDELRLLCCPVDTAPDVTRADGTLVDAERWLVD